MAARERLHPASADTLRQLVKLHGADALILAIREIEKQENASSRPLRQQPQTVKGE